MVEVQITVFLFSLKLKWIIIIGGATGNTLVCPHICFVSGLYGLLLVFGVGLLEPGVCRYAIRFWRSWECNKRYLVKLTAEWRSVVYKDSWQHHTLWNFLQLPLLRIAVNGLERKFDNAEVATIKKGLQDVRDMVNGLLDEINAKTRSNPRLEASQDGMCPALRWKNI